MLFYCCIYFILLVLLWSCYPKVLGVKVSRLLSYHPWDLATKLPLMICMTIFKIWRFKHFLYQTMINLSFVDSHVDNMLCRIAIYAKHVVVWARLTNCLSPTTIIPMCDCLALECLTTYDLIWSYIRNVKICTTRCPPLYTIFNKFKEATSNNFVIYIFSKHALNPTLFIKPCLYVKMTFAP
jgi:hypothetical protein